MKLSKNFGDYIFAISKWNGMPGWYALVTPRKYFEDTGCQYDQHLPILIPGWFDEMEGCYSPEEGKSNDPQVLFNELSALGLVFNDEFAHKMSGEEFTAWAPPATKAKTPVVASLIKTQTPSIKIDTKDCIAAISRALACNSLFLPWALSEWKRVSKKFSKPNTIRVFECKDPACPVICQTTDNSVAGVHTLDVIDKATKVSIWRVNPGSKDLKVYVSNQIQKNEAKTVTHKGSGKYKYFNISLGYVESAGIGSLFISHMTGFETPEEGLRNFLDCTKIVLHQAGEANSIVDCEEYLQRLLSETNDSWGYDDWQKYEEMGWNVPAPFVCRAITNGGEVVFVDSYLWGGEDGVDCKSIREMEDSCLGEWVIASINFPKKTKRYSSKASQKEDE